MDLEVSLHHLHSAFSFLTSLPSDVLSLHLFLLRLLLICLFFSCLFSSCPSNSCPFVLCIFFPLFSFHIYNLQQPTPAQRLLPTRYRSRTTKVAFSEQARLYPTGHNSRLASPVLTSTVRPVSEVALTRSFCPSAIATTTASSTPIPLPSNMPEPVPATTPPKVIPDTSLAMLDKSYWRLPRPFLGLSVHRDGGLRRQRQQRDGIYHTACGSCT